MGNQEWYNEVSDPIPPPRPTIPNEVPVRMYVGDAIGVDLARQDLGEQFVRLTKGIIAGVERAALQAGTAIHKFTRAFTQTYHPRCRICYPYSNPAPIPRGRGTAYARRRRHR